MVRTQLPSVVLVFAAIAVVGLLGGCPAAVIPGTTGTPTQQTEGIVSGDTTGSFDNGTGGNGAGDTTTGGDTGTGGGGAIPGVLQVKAYTDSLCGGGGDPEIMTAQHAPDDVDVNLTPTAYTIAFKRIVLKQLDDATGNTLAEVEVFSVSSIDQAKTVDLSNAAAADLLDVSNLPAGTYNKVDIEVFYLDMTIPTLYPGSTSHDIQYRMVFENMGLLRQRDLLLWLEPAWMTGYAQLSAAVTQAGWYWMERENPDHVMAVAGAAASPTFNVLDLFSNDTFWNSPHKVLEGGRISPPLNYDPAAGGVVTINFDVFETFNFKDYHDATTAADGLWEIRRDGGIHPFPPNFTCIPEAQTTQALKGEGGAVTVSGPDGK